MAVYFSGIRIKKIIERKSNQPPNECQITLKGVLSQIFSLMLLKLNANTTTILFFFLIWTQLMSQSTSWWNKVFPHHSWSSKIWVTEVAKTWPPAAKPVRASRFKQLTLLYQYTDSFINWKDRDWGRSRWLDQHLAQLLSGANKQRTGNLYN